MIIIEVYRDPKPQQQTQRGKGRFYDPSKKDREALQWQIRPYAPPQPITGPVELDLTFLMPVPKSESRMRKNQMMANCIKHVKRPDVDNLSYLVVNAMTGIIYDDDSQICDLHIHKRYAEEGKIIIKILEL